MVTKQKKFYKGPEKRQTAHTRLGDLCLGELDRLQDDNARLLTDDCASAGGLRFDGQAAAYLADPLASYKATALLMSHARNVAVQLS